MSQDILHQILSVGNGRSKAAAFERNFVGYPENTSTSFHLSQVMLAPRFPQRIQTLPSQHSLNKIITTTTTTTSIKTHCFQPFATVLAMCTTHTTHTKTSHHIDGLPSTAPKVVENSSRLGRCHGGHLPKYRGKATEIHL